MTMTSIPFSKGDGNDNLTKNSSVQYDATLNSVKIGAASSTIGAGSDNCAIIGGSTQAIGASSDNSVIIGSPGATSDSAFTGVYSSLGSVIEAGATGASIFGGASNTIESTGSSSMSLGRLQTISGSASTAMGDGTTISGNSSFCWQDGVIVDDYGTDNGFGIFCGSGALITDVTGVENAASAVLTLNSTTKGLRLPVMTTAQMNAISSPADGLFIYNSSLADLHRHEGSTWGRIPVQYTTTINTTVSGIWASAQNITLILFKQGNLVTLTWTDTRATANTADVISSAAGIIPSEFRPDGTAAGAYSLINNSASGIGRMIVTSAGTITWATSTNGNFTGSGTGGLANIGSITYVH